MRVRSNGCSAVALASVNRVVVLQAALCDLKELRTHYYGITASNLSLVYYSYENVLRTYVPITD